MNRKMRWLISNCLGVSGSWPQLTSKFLRCSLSRNRDWITPSMRRERLILFVRAPRPGAVKTRLAEALGTEQACAVYRHLVELLLREIAPLAEVELRFTPDDARAEVESWAAAHWR